MEIDISAAINRINEMINSLIAALPNIVLGVIAFFLFYLLARAIHSLVRNVSVKSGLGITAGLILGRLAQWVVVLAGLLVASAIVFPSLRASDILQLLGIGGIAIGFAFRDIAENFLAGILLLLTRPFRIGDQIVVSGYEGTVEDIQTRATFIRTYDGRRVVIPNSDLFTESVTVNTAADKRRTEIDLGISYNADIDLARQLVLETLQEIPEVLSAPPPDTLLVSLDDSTVDLRARWWTHSYLTDVLMVQDKVIDAIKKTLDKNHIDMPYPIRTVLLYNENASPSSSPS